MSLPMLFLPMLVASWNPAKDAPPGRPQRPRKPRKPRKPRPDRPAREPQDGGYVDILRRLRLTAVAPDEVEDEDYAVPTPAPKPKPRRPPRPAPKAAALPPKPRRVPKLPPPKPPAPPAPPRAARVPDAPSPVDYALGLYRYLTETETDPRRWGHRGHPNVAVQRAQEGMGGLVTDGIAGPKTFARAEALTGKKFPRRR